MKKILNSQNIFFGGGGLRIYRIWSDMWRHICFCIFIIIQRTKTYNVLPRINVKKKKNTEKFIK